MTQGIRVKICGITNHDDARVAVDAGADLLGFILYEGSPRYVEPEQVQAIIGQLKADLSPSAVSTVGVFVNASADRIRELLVSCNLDLAQLHGEESLETLAALNGRGFKALRPSQADQALIEAGRFAPQAPVTGPDLLLDAYHPELRGGTGLVGDWQMATKLTSSYRLLLAGGLTPDNVVHAVHQVRPWGVDTSSGVEAQPGRKDHAKLRAFVQAAKSAAKGRTTP